jgi:hypothetical protein
VEPNNLQKFKNAIGYSMIDSRAFLPKELVEKFIDEAVKLGLEQRMILGSAVKNVRQVSYFDSRFYDIELLTGEKVIYPSVTTLLGIIHKEWLIRMIKHLGPEEMQERLNVALDEGSLTHYVTYVAELGHVVLFEHPSWKNPDPELKEQNRAIIELSSAAGIPHWFVNNQEVMVQSLRWETVLDTMKPETLAREKIVVSTKHKFAGTLDRLWRIKAGTYPLNGSRDVKIPKDGLAVVDIKTGAEDPNYAKQESGYGEAVEESTGDVVDYNITVYVDAKTRGENSGIKVVVAERDEWKESFKMFEHAIPLWWDENGSKIPEVKKFKSIIYRPLRDSASNGGVLENMQAQAVIINAVNATLTEQLEASVAKEAPKTVDGEGELAFLRPKKGKR